MYFIHLRNCDDRNIDRDDAKKYVHYPGYYMRSIIIKNVFLIYHKKHNLNFLCLSRYKLEFNPRYMNSQIFGKGVL